MKNPPSQITNNPLQGSGFGPAPGRAKTGKKTNLILLGIVCALYLIVAVFDYPAFVQSLRLFSKLLIKVLPVLAGVYLLMFFFDLFFKPKNVAKYLGRGSGVKGYLIAVVSGILSAGPIYIWYSLLSELKKKGMKNSLVAVFLYNRAIKLPLLALMVYYFGGAFTIIITFYMILFSILIGLVFQVNDLPVSD